MCYCTNRRSLTFERLPEVEVVGTVRASCAADHVGVHDASSP